VLNVGPIELLLVLALPFSGLLAALYLGLALRNNARHSQERP
jgi:hypothetical protein